MKFTSRLFTFLFVAITLSSCEFKCSVGNTTESDDSKSKGTVKDGAAIYNGIELTANKFTLSKAYLVYDDTKERVPDNNFIDFKRTIKLVLLIKEGWTATDGKVWPGASERIVTEKGETILNEDDLFASMTDGASEKDAETVTLSATINAAAITQPTSFTVYFRVWDKKGDGVVEGSYKLYSK